MRHGRRVLCLVLLSMSLIPCLFFFFGLKNEQEEISTRPTERKRKRDFINHPVFDPEPPSTRAPVVQPKIDVFKSSDKGKKRNDLCVKFKTLNGSTPICIFNPTIDTMISSYVKDYGTWEPDLLNETGIILRQKPQLTFIDLGCNIGTFTLFVAKLGVRVIAMDVLKSALELLELSLIKGGLQRNVTLLLNAISDKPEQVTVHVVKENPGGSYIEHNKTGTVVHAITLDNLIDVVGAGSVFLKMDIEGNEYKALKGASRFFQLLKVEHILLEWAFHRYNPNGKEIIHFLLRNGMLPYEKLSTYSPLDLTRSYEWPDNIFWTKR